MPRMPDHEMTNPLPTDGRSIGRGGRKPNRRSRHLMTALKDMCQAIRTTMTVTKHRAGDGKISPASRRLEAVQNRPDLQADEHERQDVQHEDRRLPHRVGRDANPGGDALGRRPRHRHRVAHHGEHARQTNPVRQDPDAERGDELKNDGRRHVPHAVVQPQR